MPQLGSFVDPLAQGVAPGMQAVERIDHGRACSPSRYRYGRACSATVTPFVAYQAAYFAERVGAAGDCLDRVTLVQRSGEFGDFGDGLVAGVYHPVADPLPARFLTPPTRIVTIACGVDLLEEVDLKLDQLEMVSERRAFLGDQHQDIVVVNNLLLVAQGLELGEGLVDVTVLRSTPRCCSRSTKAWRPECLPNTSLLEGFYVLGLHDFVSQLVHQHPVLMDSGLVGEGVVADDRFIGGHRLADDLRQQARGG